MARGLRLYLSRLPPIDWAYLAAERRPGFRKGDKPTPEQIARRLKSFKRNIRARQKAATLKAKRRQIEARNAKLAKGINSKMLLAMQPGHWYGRPDIRDLSGVKRNSVHARLALFERRGWVERGANPDYQPIDYVKGIGIDWQARGRAPEVLFRLTPAGEAERQRLAYLE